MRILLAEDEVTIHVTLRDALEDAGHVVLHAPDTAQALALLDSARPDVVLTDIRMPGEGGMAVLKRSIELDPQRPVVLMTGYGTIDQAVEAMRIGAVNYVQKPFRNESIVQMVGTFSRVRELEEENELLRAQLSAAAPMEDFVGNSAPMRVVFERIRTVARNDATVLIEGESGTGKERVAQALHRLSPRASRPFVAISCAALPETLLEAELFGHERGAFTDARREKKGRFELADGGTIFLDDIDDMPLAMQVKLLRVLQERKFERLGSETTRALDIRVVAATKVNLREHARQGKFREDLFYRINVVPITLPPLREREGDVPLLLTHMLARHGGGRAYKVSAPTMAALERYPWPGNVRELENAVQRAIALCEPASGTSAGELALRDLVPLDPRWRGATEVGCPVRPLREVLKEAEKNHLVRALEQTGGHRSQTADALGISRKVLWEKMRDHGLLVQGESVQGESAQGESMQGE
ncbi:MAG: sigma-54-dependent Fis family transcriptional regulator [Planctomycetes bacterium]|nr:sigma-54-dependent Fis family transcriptional regulator [Planctomycetota bacterium]